MQMKGYIRAIFVWLIMGLSMSVSYAAMYEPCARPNVELPCETQGWSFSAAYLLVRPSADGLEFAQNWVPGLDKFRPFTPSVLSPASGEYQNIDPGMNNSGFRISASRFWSTGQDINANWTRIFPRTTGRDAFQTFLPITMTPPQLVGRDAVNFPDGRIHGEGRLGVDEVNLEWGQQVLLGERIEVRRHIGLQYVNILLELNTKASLDGEIDAGRPPLLYPTMLNISDEKSTFNGFGPRAGVDAAYFTGWKNVSLVGHIAGAVLLGHAQLESKVLNANQLSNLDSEEEIELFNLDNFSKLKTYSTNRVKFTAKGQLGSLYTYVTDDNNLVSLEIGYQWAIFFDSVVTPVVLRQIIAPSEDMTTLSGQVPTVGNFAYHGVYFDLKVQLFT